MYEVDVELTIIASPGVVLPGPMTSEAAVVGSRSGMMVNWVGLDFVPGNLDCRVIIGVEP